MLRRLAIPCIVAASLAVLRPTSARAQEMCDTDGGMVLPPNFGGFDQSFPSDHSVGVPIDGFVRLRYVGIAPAQPVVQVQDVSGTTPTSVSGTIGVTGAEVHWFSSAPLQPNHQYRVTFVDPTNSATSTISFSTGLSASTSGPLRFMGASSITSSRNGTSDLCGDPNAVSIGLDWPGASTNGWPETEIEYVIYETRGPGIAGPVERLRQRGSATQATCPNGDRYCTSVRLSSANATGPVCFTIQAMDPYGEPDGNSVEKCVDPSSGNFFFGCQASPRSPSRGAPVDSIVALLAVVAVSLARRRALAR